MFTLVQPPKVILETPLATLTVKGVAKPLLNVAEMATTLGLSRQTVRDHIRAGRMPAIKFGRRVLIPTVWLAELCRQAMRPGSPPARSQGSAPGQGRRTTDHTSVGPS